MPNPSHPLGAQRRIGTVAGISNWPNTIDVNIGGDNTGNDYDSGVVWPCAFDASFYPQVGDTVVLVGVPGDYVVVGQLNPNFSSRYARHKFTRVANGVAAAAFIDIGTPDTTPWSTGAVASNHSTITMTKDAFVSVYLAWSGQFGIIVTTYGTFGGGVQPYTQGGGAYQTMIGFSSLMLAGETIDFIARNHNTVADNLTSRAMVTYVDARWDVAEAG